MENTLTPPPLSQYILEDGPPIFEVQSKGGRRWRIWADGRIEGFDDGVVTLNGIYQRDWRITWLSVLPENLLRIHGSPWAMDEWTAAIMGYPAGTEMLRDDGGQIRIKFNGQLHRCPSLRESLNRAISHRRQQLHLRLPNQVGLEGFGPQSDSDQAATSPHSGSENECKSDYVGPVRTVWIGSARPDDPDPQADTREGNPE